MKSLLLASALIAFPASGMAQSAKEIVLAGYDAVFINPDPSKIDTYFSEDYKQHNPGFPDGLDCCASLPPSRLRA